MSNISLINEIWKILKPSIETGDVDEAAESLVNWMVEEDIASTTEIKNTFRGDKEIKEALDYYTESADDGLYHEDRDDYNDLYDDYYNDDEDDWG